MNAPTSKKLSLWMLTALVAGNMVGSGIFLLPAALANYGTISLLAWLFTSAGALSLAIVFSRLASIMPRIGGPYAYCREAFGDFVGFQMAYNYWIALWVGNAAIAVAFTGYLGFFFHELVVNPYLSCFVSIAVVWLMTLINSIGVRSAGIVQLITTVLKFLPLVLISFFGLFFIKPELLIQHFNVSGQSNLAAFSNAATLTLWAFIGLESASVPADSVENPKRNIARATILGVLIASCIYILSSLAVMGIVPLPQLIHANAPYAEAARMIFGPLGSWLIASGAVISCLGALNGWTLLQGQVPLAAARDNLFPPIFKKISRGNIPIVGLLASSLLITLLLLLTLNEDLTKQFTHIILLATLASLIPYLFTSMAELIIWLKYPQAFEGKSLVKAVAIALFAGIYAFWTIIGSGPTIVFYGTLLLLSSVPVYVWMRWRYAKLA